MPLPERGGGRGCVAGLTDHLGPYASPASAGSAEVMSAGGFSSRPRDTQEAEAASGSYRRIARGAHKAAHFVQRTRPSGAPRISLGRSPGA